MVGWHVRQTLDLPGGRLGKELHGGLAFAADGHMDPCVCIQGGTCSGPRQKHEGENPLQLLTALKGAVKEMESRIFPEVHSERQWVQAAAKGNLVWE